MTSRNPECRRHQTIGWEEVASLSPEESIELLFKAAEIPEDSRLSETNDAANVVEALGHHTLAIRSAGALIARRHITISEYPSFHEKHKAQVLKFGLSQDKSRYCNVFATLEASIKILEASDVEESRDALQLFQVFSWIHHKNVSIDFLECAWTEAGENEPAGNSLPQQTLKDQANHWGDSFRLLSAVERLESVALVRKDLGDKGRSLTVSMHPLEQDWSRIRLHEHRQTARSLLLANSAAILATASIGRLDKWSPWMFRFGVHLWVLHHEHSNKLELEGKAERALLIRLRVRGASCSWIDAMSKQILVSAERLKKCVDDRGKYIDELEGMSQRLDKASVLEKAAHCSDQLKKTDENVKDLASWHYQMTKYLAEAQGIFSRELELS